MYGGTGGRTMPGDLCLKLPGNAPQTPRRRERLEAPRRHGYGRIERRRPKALDRFFTVEDAGVRNRARSRIGLEKNARVVADLDPDGRIPRLSVDSHVDRRVEAVQVPGRSPAAAGQHQA